LEYDFDRVVDRRGTNSIKWSLYGEDVLPLWVADMDFPAPEPILAALRSKVEHGILGYETPSRQLRETVAARLERLYHWQVAPESIFATPGVVAGFTAAAHAVCTPGQGLLIQPPVYPPFVKLNVSADLIRQDAPLLKVVEANSIHYAIDFDSFERAIHSGGVRAGMFLLCNPHNPTGQAYSPADLLHMAEICLENDVVICSDEIHSELLLGGARHTPVAALDRTIAEQTITLIAPSKTFNIPGLFCGFAVIPNAGLRERYKRALETLALHVNSLGLTGAQAAFSGECDDWLASLRAYLTASRDFLVEYVRQELPGIRITIPEATYLAWLDCNPLLESGLIPGTPSEFFLKQARVALNNGADFGPGGEGFVRLNFGCPRSTLVEALRWIKSSLRL
jgi:cystathionine beta-lyase